MQGWPVWLASISIKDRGTIIPTEQWSRMRMKTALSTLESVLFRVGDQRKERAFRMCATLCIHRAVSSAEASMLPADWFKEPGTDLAGGSLEILYERGYASPMSTKPCTQPLRQYLDARQPKIFLPIDCGECEPCRARTACIPLVPKREAQS
ncbi:MAG: hypothetical protein NVSMB31_14510 [Vulcanimicrobiaceae bacterium]